LNYNNDFKYDLKIGQVGETMLNEILHDSTIEVKRDSWIGRTGNIAVEYQSRGKPSGISTTKASHWCFIFSNEFNDEVMIIIETNRLKRISRIFYNKGNVKLMGDNNTSKSVIIPAEKIINFID
tara:strand:+ start:78 stop:449 length:372 start_codon:yes stop_codon:yes gene_type:complete